MRRSSRAKFIREFSAVGDQWRRAVQKQQKESSMLKKLLGAAGMAALIYPTVPASAADVAGCAGADQAKAASTVEAMADGPAKFGAQREIAQAQGDLLKGNMRGCAMHLSRAMNSG